jgi:RNA polymerase sigma-70 factor (TIGR02943 family)
VSGSTNKETGNDKLLNPGEWISRHGDYLYNYAYSRVFSKELAEDLLQETFVAAIRASEGFRGDSSERTWLVSILKRKVIDHFRRKSVRKETKVADYDLPFYNDGPFKGHWISSRTPAEIHGDFQHPMQREELREILADCLSQLPEKWKAVFTLRIIEEMDSNEVCKELECSPSNLWVMLHRARLKLRECIESKWQK